MGCGSSKEVMETIEEQQKKIDDLLEINKNLEQRIIEISTNLNSEKHGNETNDVTNLKSTIDQRFNKLEKTVEKMHHEFKLKLFDGIVDNLDDEAGQNPNGSLTLDFDKEKHQDNKKDQPWGPMLQDSGVNNNKNVKYGKKDIQSGNVNMGDIKLDLKSDSMKAGDKKGKKDISYKNIMDDDQIKKINEDVANKLFKK